MILREFLVGRPLFNPGLIGRAKSLITDDRNRLGDDAVEANVSLSDWALAGLILDGKYAGACKE